MIKRIAAVLSCAGSVALLAVSTAFAASSDRIIQANICGPFVAPAITTASSAQPTDEASVRVDGTGEPGMTAVLYSNGSGVAATTVLSDGSFAVDVPLAAGQENRIKASETNPCSETKESNEIVRVRNALPVPPANPGTGTGGTGSPTPATPPPVTGLPGDGTGTDGDDGSDTGTDDGSGTDDGAGTGTGAEDGSGTDGQGSGTGTGKKPTVDSFKNGATVKDGNIWIAGQADPDSIVDIYVNGGLVARVTADSDGAYGVSVPLKRGDNTIRIRATAPDGTVTVTTVVVRYIPAGLVGWLSGQGLDWTLLAFLAVLLVLALLTFWFMVWRHRHKHRIGRPHPGPRVFMGGIRGSR